MGKPADGSFFSFIKSKPWIVLIAIAYISFLSLVGIGIATGGDSKDEQFEQGGKIETETEPSVETKTETKTESIPFQTRQENDPTLPQGQTKVKQEGKNGSKEIKVTVTYADGRETDRSAPVETVITPPQDKVILIGTYVASPPPPAPPTSPPGNCDPNYSDCVPIASDVDCAGGSGNGPAYVSGPVSVIGSDIYDLDRDGDGVGCE